MSQAVYISEDNNPIMAPCQTVTPLNIGDFVAVSGGNAVPAEEWAWAGSKANTQETFAAKFLGHCFQFKAPDVAQVYGNSLPNTVGVSTAGVYQAPLQAATTLKVGEFIGLAKNPYANALLSQVVEKVDDMAHAIGVVVQGGTNLTQATFRILSAVIPAAAPVTPAVTTTEEPTTTPAP